jgi:hypothetical protein
VLLLEWKGKRLLFVGDAEWDGGFKKGKGNCSWNVMWNLHKEQIKGALSFLKIGHHGSVNATPWGQTPAARKGEPLAILDAILPEASKANAKAVVSTYRGNYATIPRTDLLAEIGKRDPTQRTMTLRSSLRALKRPLCQSSVSTNGTHSPSRSRFVLILSARSVQKDSLMRRSSHDSKR